MNAKKETKAPAVAETEQAAVDTGADTAKAVEAGTESQAKAGKAEKKEKGKKKGNKTKKSKKK